MAETGHLTLSANDSNPSEAAPLSAGRQVPGAALDPMLEVTVANDAIARLRTGSPEFPATLERWLDMRSSEA